MTLPRVKPGDIVSANAWNAVLAAIGTPGAGAGLDTHNTPAGEEIGRAHV